MQFLRVALLWAAAVILGTPGVCAAPLSAWAQFAEPVFVRFDPNALPQNNLRVIVRDRDGFMWLGTEGGLARYDGYRFRNFFAAPQDPQALPDGYIESLLPDDGGLWIGSHSGGLTRFDERTETFRTWHRDPKGLTGPRSVSVFALARAPDGALLVGGDGGLDRFDAASGSFRPLSAGARAIVERILVDRSRVAWIGTERGLYELAPGASHVRYVPLEGNAPAPPIQSLYEDGAGRLWAGSVDHLFEIDARRRTTFAFAAQPDDARTLSPGSQLALAEPEPGTIWAGGYGGITIVDAATHRVHRVAVDSEFSGGFPGGRVFAFFRDPQGLLWVGGDAGMLLHNTVSKGLYVLSATKLGIGPSGVAGAKSLAFVDGKLWIGGNLGKIVVLDPSTGGVHTTTLANGLYVRTLAPGASGVWAVAGDRVLCHVAVGTMQAQCPAGPAAISGVRARTVVETPQTFWIGTYDGLFEENLATGSVRRYHAGEATNALTNDVIVSLMHDRQGRTWAGTIGLNVVERNGSVRRLTPVAGRDDSIGGGMISALLQDRRDRIWAGANGGPLNVLTIEPAGNIQIAHLDKSSGMPNDNVDALAQDPGGRIWASTDRGIATIDPVTLRARALGTIDGVSGYAHWVSSVAQAPDGTVFFGGLDGVTAIAPGAASPWQYSPPVVATNLSVADRAVPAWPLNRGRTLDLPANTRAFSLEFAALDYSGSQSVDYAYRLRGFDRDWVAADSDHRVATYTNLPPGNYTLQVRATNRLGIWSVYPLSIAVRAPPLWWETWWFRALLAVAAVAVVALFVNLRTSLLHQRARKLENLVAERTRELEEMSTCDPLTGLRNRRFIVGKLDVDGALAVRRYERWLATGGTPPVDADLLFFMVDLDHFKAVNDAFGHAAGDRVLVEMRERLQRVFREGDYLVRWGGEEFLIVTRGTPRTEASQVAERIRREVAERPFSIEGGHLLSKTASIGFTAFPVVLSSPRAVPWPSAVDVADHALYLAKEGGRNAWCGFLAVPESNPEAILAALANSSVDLRLAGIETFTSYGDTQSSMVRRETRTPSS